MNILILEDEIPAYEKLLNLLSHHFEVSCHFDWSRTIEQGRKLLGKGKKYDIIFSDIQLLDGTVIDLFKSLTVNCPIIFCTAYNEYLLDAFKINGIAYVLKPYTVEDISLALQKYRQLFHQERPYHIDQTVLNDVTMALKQQHSYKSRFVIKTPKGMHLLHTEHISFIEASGTFCKLIDDTGVSHLFSQSITRLNETLNPKQFFKINRSHIVNINHILRMENYFKNRLVLHMKGAKDKLITSSNSTAKFRIWLDS
ncbi:LytR/AlgR family response regulator transcription factor [Spongiimicrobium salis]|uniref:LytR/AlgR family response regulator transcription factor n=1 Tax=Spongiimicrobium salis TaxID=1667022 RepID=UPI00374DB7C6